MPVDEEFAMDVKPIKNKWSIKPIAMFTGIHIFILYGLYLTSFLAYEVKDDFLMNVDTIFTHMRHH